MFYGFRETLCHDVLRPNCQPLARSLFVDGMRCIDQQENAEANAGAFEHAAGAFSSARLVLFVSCFQRGGAHSLVIIVGPVLQVACDNVAWSCGLGHTLLATHDRDPSLKSLSTLINMTEISEYAPVGVQSRCYGLAFDNGYHDGHFGVRYGYTR